MTLREEITALARGALSFTMTQARFSTGGSDNAIGSMLSDMVRRGQLVRVAVGVYALPEKADEARANPIRKPKQQRRTPAQRADETSGPVAQAILRALAKGGPLQMVELKRAAHAHSGGETVEALVLALSHAGLVIRNSRGHFLTDKGRLRVPSAPPVMPEMRPYRPPVAPPRRPGAMAFLQAPSVYAEGPR